MKEDVRTSKPKKHAIKVIFRVYQTLESLVELQCLTTQDYNSSNDHR